MDKDKKRLLRRGILGVFAAGLLLFGLWKETPRTFSQRLPAYQQATGCQIFHVGMEVSEDFGLVVKGEALRELLTWLEQWKLYPDRRVGGGRGSEMLEGFVCHLYFYSPEGHLGEVSITDLGVFSDHTLPYNNRVRDETFRKSWRAFLREYEERYGE